jgi:hypothetical protein
MIKDKTPVSARFASKPVDRYTAGTRSASFKGQRGEDVNVKRAAALVASAISVLVLAAVVGLGHVASHSSGTPAKATLTARIYGDSVNVPASTSTSSSSTTSSSTPSYADDSSGYTSYYGDGSSTGSSSTGDSIYGDGTGSIYGDGSSIYGDGSSSSTSSGSNTIYGDGGSGVHPAIYGD